MGHIVYKLSHKVYGFKLVLSEDNAYITIQNIENNTIEIHDGDDDDVPADIQKVLVMLVLTNIFMSSTPVNEGIAIFYFKYFIMLFRLRLNTLANNI